MNNRLTNSEALPAPLKFSHTARKAKKMEMH